MARYGFDQSSRDASGNGNDAAVLGHPTYGVGPGGVRALVLDGVNDSLRLPAGSVDSKELTVALWVYPQAAAQWARLFDFGNDETQYFFLTAQSSERTLRLAARNGAGEITLDAPGLPENRWSHVAVTLSGMTAKLFVNGKLVATKDDWSIKPADFKPIFNYIGKSQFAVDPMLRGRVADLRVYNYALPAEDVAALTKAK
ncbi:MAG: LamG domain-containing protein [Tepidisphaeraceae bacterium]